MNIKKLMNNLIKYLIKKFASKKWIKIKNLLFQGNDKYILFYKIL